MIVTDTICLDRWPMAKVPKKIWKYTIADILKKSEEVMQIHKFYIIYAKVRMQQTLSYVA